MTASRGGKAAGTPGAGRGRGAASLALKRIVGYVEEPGSGDDAGNPFVLSSSEDEVEEEGVVDRCAAEMQGWWGWVVHGRASRWRGVGGAGARPLDAAASPQPPSWCDLLAHAHSNRYRLRPAASCRQYLKHRAHKLTNPKVRGKAGVGAAANSPAAPMDAR